VAQKTSPHHCWSRRKPSSYCLHYPWKIAPRGQRGAVEQRDQLRIELDRTGLLPLHLLHPLHLPLIATVSYIAVLFNTLVKLSRNYKGSAIFVRVSFLGKIIISYDGSAELNRKMIFCLCLHVMWTEPVCKSSNTGRSAHNALLFS